MRKSRNFDAVVVRALAFSFSLESCLAHDTRQTTNARVARIPRRRIAPVATDCMHSYVFSGGKSLGYHVFYFPILNSLEVGMPRGDPRFLGALPPDLPPTFSLSFPFSLSLSTLRLHPVREKSVSVSSPRSAPELYECTEIYSSFSR